MNRISLIIFIILEISILFSNGVFAQDIHFSQFYTSAMALNPAETGFFEGNWRFSNNYRNQWSALGIPFRTVAVGFDKPFRIKSHSDIGLGVYAINDNSGNTKLTVNKIYLSTSYIRKISRIHLFSIGLQIGYAFKSFSLSGITLPGQYNHGTGYFDPDFPLNTRDMNTDLNYLDINTGITYEYRSGKIRPYGGVSLYHINKPKESFLNSNNSRLPVRMTVNGGAKINISHNIIINPHFLTMYHKKAGDWVVGSLIYFLIPDRPVLRNIFGGIDYRTSWHNMDSFIFTGGVNLFGLDIGLSYDMNISRLRRATNFRGGFELSVIYKDIRKKKIEITIPCDRY